jgi:sugar phosphate isomerase/epimerase
MSATRPGGRRRTGLSSYAYRWSCAAAGEGALLDPGSFLARAARFGLEGVQLCDNLPWQELPAAALRDLRAAAADRGLFIETGARSTDPGRLTAALEASARLGSPLLRVVTEIDRSRPAAGIAAQLERISAELRAVLGRARDAGIRIALENHATLSSPDLLRILTAVDDELLGVCLDTMNSVLHLERPLETARALAPYIFSVHLKDFRVEKHPEELRVCGVPLGQGLVDVPAVLALLDEQERKGVREAALHLELYVGRRGSAQATLDYEDACVAESAEFLRGLLAGGS